MDDSFVSQTSGTLYMAQVEKFHFGNRVRFVKAFRPIAQVGHRVDIYRFTEVDRTHIERSHLYFRNVKTDTAFGKGEGRESARRALYYHVRFLADETDGLTEDVQFKRRIAL